MLNNHRTFTTTFAGRELVIETGKTSELANGSCWVKYGETVVMANVTTVSYTHLYQSNRSQQKVVIKYMKK